jgi:glycine/D-amino acid oxidase-like deaminating enzyme
MRTIEPPKKTEVEKWNTPAFHGGTYNGHPTAAAAGLATLEILDSSDVDDHIDRLGEKLFEGLQVVADDVGIAANVEHIGSMGQVYMTDHEIARYRDTWHANEEQFADWWLEAAAGGVLFGNPMQGEWFSRPKPTRTNRWRMPWRSPKKPSVRSTTTTSRMQEVIVVGGGVVGCAVAHELAPDRDVLVVEAGQLAAEATVLAAGEITITPSYSDVPEVAEHANEFFRSFDGTGEFEFTERESLELVPPDREGEARRRAERLAGNGIPVEYLDVETVEETYPRFDMGEFDGGVRHHGTGFVDPYSLAMALCGEAEERGATFRTHTPVAEVLVEDGAVTGVKTADDETIRASTVIAAAGWRTPDLLADLVKLPVRPYRTQCVVLEPDTPLGDGFPMGWVPGQHVYFRPEHNGDLLVGGWSFAEDDPESASRSEDEEFRDHVADLVPGFLEDFDAARFVNGWAGIDGATPDTRPIIDTPSEASDGLVVATGFHGRGVMTAPVAATAVGSLVRGEDGPFPLDPFRLDRFDSRSSGFPFVSISSGK